MSMSRVRNHFLVILLATATTVAAQDVPLVSFEVGSITRSEDSPGQRALAGVVKTALSRELAYQGLELSPSPVWTFLIGVDKTSDSSFVALSVVAFANMPEPIVQLGRDNEAFYLTMGGEPGPAEGKFVRQHVSEGYMRQFVMPQEHFVRVVEPEELETTVAEIAEQFRARHFREG